MEAIKFANEDLIERLLPVLDNFEAASTTKTSDSIIKIAENIKTRGLIIVISDFLDSSDDILSSLKRFYYKKNEVIVFQILDPAEKNFSFSNDSIFVDIETKEELNTQPIQIRKAYIEAMNDHLAKLKTGCEKYGFDYNLIDTSMKYDSAMMNFFKKRSRLN